MVPQKIMPMIQSLRKVCSVCCILSERGMSPYPVTCFVLTNCGKRSVANILQAAVCDKLLRLPYQKEHAYSYYSFYIHIHIHIHTYIYIFIYIYIYMYIYIYI